MNGNDRLDPSSAALYAIIAACLVITGALLTAGPLTVEQRSAGVGAIFAALAFVVWRGKSHRRGGNDDTEDE